MSAGWDERPTVPVSPHAEHIALSVSELSNVLMCLGVTVEPLNAEAERIIAHHLRCAYMLGIGQNKDKVQALQTALSAKNLMIKKLEDDMDDIRTIIHAIRKGTM